MLNVDINFANPDPNVCPENVTELIALLDTLVSGQVLEDFRPYIVGAATPGTEQQNLVWHRLDVNGKPVGTFLYTAGRWRRQYSGLPNQLLFYSGDPSFDFDDDGRGKLEGDDGATGVWDGWHLCNGNGGTPDLRDKFIVGGKEYDTGLGRWKTAVSGSDTTEGGAKDITLNEANTYATPHAGVTIYRRTADGETASDTGGLYGFPDQGATVLVPPFAGNTDPDEIPTLPPYYALAIVQFVGYV